MKKFEDICTNVTNTFPDCTADDESGVGAEDGAELLADWINNFWGWAQDLLDRASITPSGTVEAAGASQLSQAIQCMKGIPGEVFVWMGQADPATLTPAPRVLLLDGSTVLTADYSDLVDATHCTGAGVTDVQIYTYYGTDAGFYRCNNSDGTSPNASGIYYKLPDMRGYFLRGWDPTGIIDQSLPLVNGGWPVGDRYEGHKHFITTKDFYSDAGTNYYLKYNASANASSGGDLIVPTIETYSGGSTYFKASGTTASTTTGETHPYYRPASFAVWY